jgi:flagellar hook-basal body complex protein FliE
MEFLSARQVSGHVVELLRSDPRHLPRTAATPARAGVEESFGALLSRALGGVNADQLSAMELSQKLITDPDSVNVHDVTIALAQANLSLSMTKAVFDRAIQAYREIISTR